MSTTLAWIVLSMLGWWYFGQLLLDCGTSLAQPIGSGVIAVFYIAAGTGLALITAGNLANREANRFRPGNAVTAVVVLIPSMLLALFLALLLASFWPDQISSTPLASAGSGFAAATVVVALTHGLMIGPQTMCLVVMIIGWIGRRRESNPRLIGLVAAGAFLVFWVLGATLLLCYPQGGCYSAP